MGENRATATSVASDESWILIFVFLFLGDYISMPTSNNMTLAKIRSTNILHYYY